MWSTYDHIQGEDEVMFMEYRRELKVLFDNVTQLVSCLLAVYSNYLSVCSIRVLLSAFVVFWAGVGNNSPVASGYTKSIRQWIIHEHWSSIKVLLHDGWGVTR